MASKKIFPEVESCCYCVPELKVATAIIAVLGIVTSPSVAWALVRHSYVLRVACYVTTSSNRSDVVDISLQNVISFGFGPNAGIGPSCLEAKSTEPLQEKIAKEKEKKDALFRAVEQSDSSNSFANAIKCMGWIVFVFDVFFVCACIYLFSVIFRKNAKRALVIFLCTLLPTIILSLIYSILYISACLSTGGAFPIFELICGIVDLLLWCYFLVVVNSFRTQGT